jgi:hypothetical protein
VSTIWLIPALVFFVGGIVLFDALRRMANEAELMMRRIAAVREPTPDARRLHAEARALSATVKGLTRL